MKLKAIMLGDKEYAINENINIISGYTKANKTVLFYAFEYLFCIDSSLELSNAIDALKCNSIKAIFGDDTITFAVEREFSEKFKGIIDDIPYDSMKKYKKDLALKFGFNEIFVDNNNQKNQFFLKDYLKIILIPEEQLTSIKNIFERNGELDKGKMIAFFNYMITGKTMDDGLISKKTKAKKSETNISQFITAYNRIYKKPTKTEISKYNFAKEKIVEVVQEISNIKLEIDKCINQKKELEDSNIRLSVLVNSYEEDMKSFKFAKYFECIEELIDEELDIVEYEYYSSLKNSITDIKKLYFENITQISKIDKQIVTLKNELSSLVDKETKYKTIIENYKHILQYNQMIELTTNMCVDNEKIKEEITNEVENHKKLINDEFKSNLIELCMNIRKRLVSWGITDINVVSFDTKTYDFEFDSTPVKIRPKGEKSIFSLAVNVEIVLLMKSLGIVVPDFLIIDSCWVATDLRELTQDQIKNNIVSNLLESNLQIIIFENEDRKQKIENCTYIYL